MFGELVNNDGGNDIGKEDLEKSPVNNIRHELVLVPILVHTLADDLLGIQRLDAWRDRVTVLVDSVDVNINLFIFIQGDDVVVDGQETENERENHSQKTHDQQLFPGQFDRFENAFQQLYFAKYEN